MALAEQLVVAVVGASAGAAIIVVSATLAWLFKRQVEQGTKLQQIESRVDRFKGLETYMERAAADALSRAFGGGPDLPER